MPYSRFKSWDETDRGLVLALQAEEDETCPQCGHLISECRDPKTAGSWRVVEQICEPSRVAQAAAENAFESKRRGVLFLTQRDR